MSVTGETARDRRPAREADLPAWLAWLEGGRGEHVDLGLERPREVAARLDLNRPAPVVVTVAGTNGKGSSVALLCAIWRAAGYRVGAYTSPHLLRYNERIRVDAREASDSDIVDAFARVEAARREVALTYFEFGTLAALDLFARAALDVAVLEVGMGGRLDAVNIVDADAALIAAIGLDHEEWLGSTRAAIAVEKAGVMRAGRLAVCSDDDIPDSLIAHARAIGAPLARLGVEFCFEDEGSSWSWWHGERVMSELPRPALTGAHQLRNAAGVLTVVDALRARLPVAAEHIRAGLRDVALPARFQRVTREHEYIIDVAHNPQAASIVTATLDELPPAARTHAIVGMLSNKNHAGFFSALLGRVDAWHLATLPGVRGARAEDLALCLKRVAPGARLACHASVADAHVACVQTAAPGERILVLGSFLTAGAMLARLTARR